MVITYMWTIRAKAQSKVCQWKCWDLIGWIVRIVSLEGCKVRKNKISKQSHITPKGNDEVIYKSRHSELKKEMVKWYISANNSLISMKLLDKPVKLRLK